MTTIILTIIGILLAAAAALMVIFYGGDAFNSGSVGAAANTIQNAGTNVLSAVQMYKVEKAASPTSMADLRTAGVGGSFLKEDPSLPPSPSTTGYSLTGSQYIVTGVEATICTRINANLKLTGVTSATASTSQKMICIPNATAGAAGTFYANA